MVKLTPQVLDILRRPDSNKVMTTINSDGTPHSIVCGTLYVPDDETIGVGKVWLKTTGANLSADPRAEFLVWYGKYAYSIQAVLSERSVESEDVDPVNEGLEKMDMSVRSVWFFTPSSVTDEGITPTVGKKII